MSLLKDSVIYGGSSILSKMVSWLMTILFTYTLSTAEFGIMTNLYAIMALIIVLLTFGMETGFFRFINQTDTYKPKDVYNNVLTIVGLIVISAVIIFQVFLQQIRPFIWQNEVPDIYIRLIIIIFALDSFIAIPFAYLRHKKRPIKFGSLKILNVVLYAILCTFFLVICPQINKHNPDLIAWFWNSDFKVGYILISNIIATAIESLCLIPELIGYKFTLHTELTKKLFRYSFPLVIMGIAGMSNQVFDKILFPIIYSDPEVAFSELGVYSGCFKIALIMIMFTQAFRYAYEPFIFEKSKQTDAKQSYANVMKYFIIFGLFIFLSVSFYLDILKYFVDEPYRVAIWIVPIALMGELFFAIYSNLSLWYKLNDKTHWGMIFSIIACVIIILINIIFIPIYGYGACAWAVFIGNGIIMLLSYIIGQKNYRINYDLKTILIYFGLATLLFTISYLAPINNEWIRMGFNTILLLAYIAFTIKRDIKLKDIPYINRFIK
ncbi:O-antigen/teichoic acid export membrane protein [Dysgonomonadaceae bacterium PH5-43]|nr:O-antigen/teichoic acid export membrane protein [Dysgonomonadaceae bacterium PH5-43]